MELRTDRMKLAEVFPDIAKTFARKLHIKAGEIEYVRKGIPIDPADISIEDGERAAIRLVSTPHLDRDGEILIPAGAQLDEFRQSPTVLYAHDYSGLPIGKDIWIKITPKGILAKTVFAEHQFADDVYGCVKGGFLNANSVGFIPTEIVSNGEKGFDAWQGILEKDYGILKDESSKAKRIYTKWVMLEHSDCPVCSNAPSLNLLVGKSISSRLKKDLGVPDDPVIGSVAEVRAEDDTPADMVTCPKCKTEFEFGPEKADAEGYMPCPECAAMVNADGEMKPEKSVVDTETKTEPAPIAVEPGLDIIADTKADESPVQQAGTIDMSADILDPPCTFADLRAAVTELTARIEDVKSAIPPAPAPVEPDEFIASMPLMIADLCEQVSEVKRMIEALKAAPVIPPVEPAPIVEPPAPAVPVDYAAAVREAVKTLDIAAIVKKETQLALSKLRGKVESK